MVAHNITYFSEQLGVALLPSPAFIFQALDVFILRLKLRLSQT